MILKITIAAVVWFVGFIAGMLFCIVFDTDYIDINDDCDES